MTFSEAEKAAITSIWGKVSGHESEIGEEALQRLFLAFPQTKTYFSNFNLSHGSADLSRHGGKIINAIGNAVTHLDNLDHAMSALSDLHAQNLRVDPGNFKLLSHALLVTLAVHFPNDFNASVQAALDKFLSAVSSVLVSKYR